MAGSTRPFTPTDPTATTTGNANGHSNSRATDNANGHTNSRATGPKDRATGPKDRLQVQHAR